MRLTADQNGARLIKKAREEIGLQPRSKVIMRQAQQVFSLSIFRVQGKTSVIRVFPGVPSLGKVQGARVHNGTILNS